MTYQIRKATPVDMPEIIKLCAAHAAYEKAAYTAEGKEEKLSSFLFASEPRLHCLLAEDENKKPIGYATYMQEFSTWDAAYYTHLDCLFVSERARSLGIGERLVHEIKQQSKKMGSTHLQWQTPDWNERAIKFYYRIGAKSKSKLRMYLEH